MKRRGQYTLWMDNYVQGDGYSKCLEASLLMSADFPELKRRRGFYHCPIWGPRQHWWNVLGDQIVDPTGGQFPSGMRFPDAETSLRYQDLTEASDEEMEQLVPTGVCLECGEPVYQARTFCSDACADATAVAMNADLRGDI